MKTIIFDTETTGTDPVKDQIVEICIQQGLETGAEVKTRRIKPSIPISPGAQAVHGISNEDLADCPSFVAVAKSLKALFDECEAIMGYNVKFDLEILQNEFKRAKLEPLDLSAKLILDPLMIWRHFERRNLASAYQKFVGGEFSEAHSAEADVKATAAVFHGMLKAFDIEQKPWEELAALTFPPEWIGLSHHFQWRDSKAVFTFGKFTGKPIWKSVHSDTSYADWMKKQDFPSHVVEILDATLEMDKQSFGDWLTERYPPPAG